MGMKLDKDTLVQAAVLFVLWVAFQVEFKKFIDRVR